MKILNDSKQLQLFIEGNDLLKHLSSLDLKFSQLCFEKGEFLVSPDKPIEDLLFLVNGQVQIYNISPGGEIKPFMLKSEFLMLGDVEFCHRGREPFFIEAATDVICLVLSISSSRDILEKDIPFLLYLSDSLACKLEQITISDTCAVTVREKVLFYMKNVFPDGTLNGVEKSAVQLRCSERQLLRVLRELCSTGEIEQIGKGRYRLRENF